LINSCQAPPKTLSSSGLLSLAADSLAVIFAIGHASRGRGRGANDNSFPILHRLVEQLVCVESVNTPSTT